MAAKKEKLKLRFSKAFVVFAVCIVIVLALCVTGVMMINGNNNLFSKKTESLRRKPEYSIKKEAVDYEAQVFMVGDSLIHGGVYDDAREWNGSYDFKPMLQHMKPIVSKYDIAYYNQETVLGGKEIGISSYPQFNSPQEVGDAFIDAGFNLVSLATNHTMDRGEDGVLRSVEYWKKHPEIGTSGQWSSYDDRTAGINRIYEVNNIKYAFISYTTWTNGLETPYGKDYLNNVYSDEKAKADIEAVRDKVDFVLVAMHWGTEYSFGVDNSQERIAAYLSNLGVDLIIGAHPHVVETVEYINDGKTFVIYSLGNFLSDQLDVDNYTGLGMEVTLRKHVDLEGKATNSVVEPKAQLFYTVTNGRANGYTKRFINKTYPTLNENELRNHASLYERYKAIVNERYPDLTWGLTWE